MGENARKTEADDITPEERGHNTREKHFQGADNFPNRRSLVARSCYHRASRSAALLIFAGFGNVASSNGFAKPTGVNSEPTR